MVKAGPRFGRSFTATGVGSGSGNTANPQVGSSGDQALELGARGILFCSISSPDGHNLALFTQQLNTDDWIEVYDPDHRLPKNQESGRS